MDRTALNSILADYESILRNHKPAISAPLAAVLAATRALSEHNVQTASEGLAILSRIAVELKNGCDNLLPVSAGVDTFQRKLVTSISRPSPESKRDAAAPQASSAPQDTVALDKTNFEDMKRRTLEAGREFVREGVTARERLARFGRRLVQPGSVVIVPSPSKAVSAVLEDAARAGSRFSAVILDDGKADPADHATQSPRAVAARLTELSASTQLISPDDLPHAFEHTNKSLAGMHYNGTAPKRMVLSGAHALLSDGSILASKGTLVAALLAESSRASFWVAAELFKCARHFPSIDRRVLGREALGKKTDASDIIVSVSFHLLREEKSLLRHVGLVEDARLEGARPNYPSAN